MLEMLAGICHQELLTHLLGRAHLICDLEKMLSHEKPGNRIQVKLQKKIRKMMVLLERQKEVLLMDHLSGGSIRSTNKGHVLYMDIAHLLGHQHQAHLNHREAMASRVTRPWCLKWQDLENTKECFFQLMKYLCFILT